MIQKLWRFTDNQGTFESYLADKVRGLYFPLCNDALLSCVSPTLHGDIKTSQSSFLLIPVSRIDLENSRSSRNFWVYVNKDNAWSATGVSKDLKQIKQDSLKLEAGLIWHKVTRENKHVGLRAEILSFVPASQEPVEIMVASFTNISSRKIKFIPTAAIPIYARGANNLRDHRQVTSLLQRITVDKFGVIVKPTLVFDEGGHKPNKTHYFVLGWDEKFKFPQYIYPTQEMFCGEAGDLEAPQSILKNILPAKQFIQGKEAFGGLRFSAITLYPGQTHSYILLMGVVEEKAQIPRIVRRFKSVRGVQKAWEETKSFWVDKSNKIKVSTGHTDFDNWFRWVSIQPVLRKIFGCSFLPDFDYGKGGHGWRDLWQDCLSLILNDPRCVRSLLIDNFSGVRVDGSNATIIGSKPGEFIADRNNISRVWMDHGVWPLLTLDLYINETGDFDILFEKTSYFRDHQTCRCRQLDPHWTSSRGEKLKSSSGKIYTGTVLEHLLVESLVQFFNVGSHNFIRLEGADWNDGLDMAKEKGESVTFSAMYAHNLRLLSDLLLKTTHPKIAIAKELTLLLGRINYNGVKEKIKVLDEYFLKTETCVLGVKVMIDTAKLASDLRRKSERLLRHIRKDAWLAEGFFNGYYDNAGKRVDGKNKNLARITLASQVFPILSLAAQEGQIEKVLRSVEKFLEDKKLKGIHLNTDFIQEQHNLGRAFSFVYGDKENGAFFNHMIVMFAYALYKRGFVSNGWQALSSIYRMALDTEKSKIYPCLPEYFNREARGMYSYLTGSASWFLLTLVTQVFGIKGKDGDLLIEPKLCREQFKDTQVLRINRNFAGKSLEVSFFNPKKLDYPRFKIVKASLNSRPLPLRESPSFIINRRTFLRLASQKINKLDIHFG